MLKRWDRFARFIEDGRVCLTNNAAERALRGFALGRKSWMFAGSERGADRAAAMATLNMSALCRARHKPDYAAHRTMPNGPGRRVGCRAAAVSRADGGNVPFGIVRPLIVPPGRRAADRWPGSGFVCRAGTA